MSTPVARGQKGILTMLGHPRALWAFLRDPKSPRSARVVAVLALLYLISPVDAVPELLTPIVGWLDDLGATGLALAWLASQAAKYENARALREAQGEAIKVEPPPTPPAGEAT